MSLEYAGSFPAVGHYSHLAKLTHLFVMWETVAGQQSTVSTKLFTIARKHSHAVWLPPRVTDCQSVFVFASYVIPRLCVGNNVRWLFWGHCGVVKKLTMANPGGDGLVKKDRCQNGRLEGSWGSKSWCTGVKDRHFPTNAFSHGTANSSLATPNLLVILSKLLSPALKRLAQNPCGTARWRFGVWDCDFSLC